MVDEFSAVAEVVLEFVAGSRVVTVVAFALVALRVWAADGARTRPSSTGSDDNRKRRERRILLRCTPLYDHRWLPGADRRKAAWPEGEKREETKRKGAQGPRDGSVAQLLMGEKRKKAAAALNGAIAEGRGGKPRAAEEEKHEAKERASCINHTTEKDDGGLASGCSFGPALLIRYRQRGHRGCNTRWSTPRERECVREGKA